MNGEKINLGNNKGSCTTTTTAKLSLCRGKKQFSRPKRRKSLGMSSSKSFSVTFNQDYSCIAVGSESSFKIFNVDPFGECFELDEGVNVSQMLFSTSLVAAVGSGSGPSSSPRRLRILNTKKKSNICELTFPTAVLSVKLNRKRLVAVLIDQIYIYDISCMKLLHTIETSPNPKALCDLSSNDDSILIYPAPGPNVASPFNTDSDSKEPGSEVGTVVLFDGLNIAPLNIVKAHKAELVTLTLNSNGTLFATASVKGTIIRVFSTLTGEKVAQFRRGSYPATIQNVAFDLGSKLLAVTSDTETVHIFKVELKEGTNQSNNSDDEQDDENDDSEPNILPRLGPSNSEPERKRQPSITDRVLRNLPKNITSMLEPHRDFAYLKVPNHQKQKKSTVGFSSKDVVVASSDGSLYTYTIPPNGGECVLVNEYALG